MLTEATLLQKGNVCDSQAVYFNPKIRKKFKRVFFRLYWVRVGVKLSTGKNGVDADKADQSTWTRVEIDLIMLT